MSDLNCLKLCWTFRALSACSQNDELENELKAVKEQLAARDEFWRTPRYGDIKPVRGEITTSGIRLCQSNRVHCVWPRNADGSEQSCSINSLPENWPAGLPDGSDPTEYGEYWFEGDARIAILPGSFGHSGQQTCQIEIHKTRILKQTFP